MNTINKDIVKKTAQSILLGTYCGTSPTVKAHTHMPILVYNRPILAYKRLIIVVELADYSANSYQTSTLQSLIPMADLSKRESARYNWSLWVWGLRQASTGLSEAVCR